MQVEITGLTHRYGGFEALRNVSLSVTPGSIVAVLGANGAGKTTLLRCMAGVLGIRDGVVAYDGQRFGRGAMALRRRIFFLPDYPPLMADQTVLQHLGMVVRLYQVESPEAEARAAALLRDFDLLALADIRVRQLSRGQAYKTALAALATVQPGLWLLDEPFASGMDPHGLTAFKRLAREAAAHGATVLYSTQILDVAEQFSDRVCILDKGAVHAFGSVAELRAAGAGDKPLEEIFARLREGAA